MATVLDYTQEDKTQIALGLSTLIPGSPSAANISGLSETALQTYLNLSRANIDRNAGQRNVVPTEGVLSADTVRRTPGAKDRALGTLAEIKANPDLLSDPAYMQQYQALIGAVGGPLDHDWGTVSAEEAAYLPTLETRLNSGVSLNTIFANSTAEAEAAQQAALEAAARTEAEQRAAAEVHAQTTAGLIYAGYLEPGEAANVGAAEYAVKRLIVANFPPSDWGAEQAKLFTNGIGGEMTPYAVLFLREHIGGFDNNSAGLKADLESGDAARITQAQSYLNLMGADLEVNGTYDRATADAALATLHAPLSMPEGIINAGGVDYNALYEGARAGMIALPMDRLDQYLSADVVEVANMYPLASETNDPMAMTREAFVAERMIADNPAVYERFLADQNAERAAMTISTPILDVAEVRQENVAPVVAVAEQNLETTNLPPSFAAVLASYATEHDGYISVSEIPMLLDRAKFGENSTMSIDQSLNSAEDAALAVGMDTADVRINISLDPTSPEFQANFVQALSYAYVFENAHETGPDGNKITMSNIPTNVLTSLNQTAASQTVVSNTGTDNMLESLGLPPGTIAALRNATGSDGRTLSINDIPGALVTMDDPQILNRLGTGDPILSLFASNVYEDGPQTPAIQNIINTGYIDLRDPAQLSLALQISVALREGKPLEEISPEFAQRTDAIAQGFLGTNANPRAVPVDPASEEKIRLHQYFSGPAEGVTPGSPTRATPQVSPEPFNPEPQIGMAMM